MKKNMRKRAAAVATGAALALVAGGVAYGYWTTSGAGTGSASTGNSQAIVINGPASVTGLYPGASAAALAGNFDNSNPGNVYVAKVTVAIQSGWSSQGDAGKPACTAADFTLTQPADVEAQIPAGDGVGSWGGASIALKNLATNQDNCKNVTVPLVFTSN
jgi:hypothetical protein